MTKHAVRQKIYVLASEAQRNHPELRYGQAIFNAACKMTNKANALAGTDLDPFYNDSKVEAFLDVVTVEEQS